MSKVDARKINKENICEILFYSTLYYLIQFSFPSRFSYCIVLLLFVFAVFYVHKFFFLSYSLTYMSGALVEEDD